MTAPANKQVIERFYAAGNSGDLETCLGLMTDDVQWTNIGSTRYSGTFHGKQSLLDELIGPVFSQFQAGLISTIDNVVAEGDCVVVQSRGMAVTREGRPYNNTYCHVFHLRDGLIARVTEYFDTELTAQTLAK